MFSSHFDSRIYKGRRRVLQRLHHQLICLSQLQGLVWTLAGAGPLVQDDTSRHGA